MSPSRFWRRCHLLKRSTKDLNESEPVVTQLANELRRPFWCQPFADRENLCNQFYLVSTTLYQGSQCFCSPKFASDYGYLFIKLSILNVNLSSFQGEERKKEVHSRDCLGGEFCTRLYTHSSQRYLNILFPID